MRLIDGITQHMPHLGKGSSGISDGEMEPLFILSF